ncbi:MAG: hypothetical protein V1789_04205 [PVC group bacterium]
MRARRENLKVGIYRTSDPNGKYCAVNTAYEKILAHNGIAFVRLEDSQPDFWDAIRDFDLFILRWSQWDSDRQIALDLLPVIEENLKIKCFPDLNTCWHSDDKVRQYFLLKPFGFPMVESHIFRERGAALNWAGRADFPVVFKLRGGAGSQNVIMVEDRRQARKLIKRMFGRGILPEKFIHAGSVRFRHFSLYRELHHRAGNLCRRWKSLDVSPFWRLHKNYILFQDFIPGNRFDTRVTVIGERAFIFRRFTRPNDFRASGSGMIDYDLGRVDLRCVEIAFRISREMKFQSMAYDFLFTPDNEPVFCEISYTFQPRAIFDCPGYFDRFLHLNEGHFWPEYLHLVDALKLPDLEQPELDY